MDIEVTLDQQPARSSTAARPAEEFRGHHGAAGIEQILHASLDEQAKRSDADTQEPSLAERFAGIVYFSEMAADNPNRRSPHSRPAGGVPAAESVRPARGRRAPVRPWRLPAANRNPKS